MLQSVVVPRSLAEAHAALGDGARLIAGGTAVMPELGQGSDAVTRLVSLRRAGLAGLRIRDGRASIGAAATLADLEAEPGLAFLAPALRAVASPTIRNMATVGGNLFAKQPYGDLATCLIALGAVATVSAAAATREVAVEALVAGGPQPGEIVTSVAFDVPAPGSFRFAKAGRKALNAAAIVTVAATVADEGGTVAACRVALGGVAPSAVRSPSAEAALAGRRLGRAAAEEAGRRALQDIDPFDDAYASAWYRRRLTPVHVRRALIGE
jgi:CO/xanthine dehydrogenase FAD-binding subunit